MTGLEFSTVAYINKRIDIVNTGGKKKEKEKDYSKNRKFVNSCHHE